MQTEIDTCCLWFRSVGVLRVCIARRQNTDGGQKRGPAHWCDVDKITFKAASLPVYSPVTNIIFLGWDVSDLHCTLGFLTRTAQLPLFFECDTNIFAGVVCLFFDHLPDAQSTGQTSAKRWRVYSNMRRMQRKCGRHPPNIPCYVCLVLLLIKSTHKKKLLPWADRVRVKKKQQENCISTTATFAETHSYSAAVSTNTAHGAAMQLAMVSVVHSGTAKDQWCLLVWEMRLPICLNLGYKSKNILAVLEIRWKCSRREYQTNICLFFFSSLRVNKRRINIVFVMLTVV